MAKLKAGYIIRQCKVHWGIAEFAGDLGVSEDSFRNIFFKSFSGKTANSLWREIQKNSKKKHTSSSATSITHTTTVTCVTTTMTTMVAEKVPINSDNETTSDSIVHISNDGSSVLANLEARKATLIEEISEEEKEHLRLSSERSNIFSKISAHEEWLKNVLLEIHKHRSEVIDLSSKAETLARDMKMVSRRISQKRDKLTELEIEIATSKKVSILAYESGEIEFENCHERDIASAETATMWPEIYASIRDFSVAEDLKVKEVKQVAKVIAFTRRLDACGTAFELTFENEAAQALFDACVKKA